MLISVSVAAALLLTATIFAFTSRRSEQDARLYFAAAGQFGLILYAVLAIGDTYSVGTVLGFPGSIYAEGGYAAIWFCGYILLAFPIATVLYPRLWQLGRQCDAATLPDLFRHHFNDHRLDLLLAALLFACFLPLGTSQFIGLQSALRVVGDSVISPSQIPFALGLSALLTFLMASRQGMGGAARAAVFKDALIITAIAVTAFAAISAEAGWNLVGHSMAEGSAQPFHPFQPSFQGDLFILTTIAVQATSFCISPPALAAVFSAHRVETLRRGQIWMPLYMVLFPLLAIIAVFGHHHKIAASRPDEIFLATAQALLPDWAMGFVLAGTCLAAIVILASCGITLGGIVARSVMRGRSAQQQIRIGLAAIAAYIALSLTGALTAKDLLVSLNTMFYLGLAQILPGVMAMIFNWRVSSTAIMGGMIGGLAIGCVLRFGGLHLFGINPAFIALTVNFCLCCCVCQRRKR